MAKKNGNGEDSPQIKQELANVPMGKGGFALGTLDQGYRYAQYLAASEIVPNTYRNKPADCLVALDLAGRLGVSWLAVMQNVYPVHGRPGMMATLVISLINASGLFTDPLDYEVVGDDPDKDNYKVRAFATRKSTGKVLHGPWITWKLVRAEKWDQKEGSKWLTMSDQMFHYRAASWFANRHCPEVKMGMMTTDEAEELPPRHVESREVQPGVEALKERIKAQQQATEPEATSDTPTPDQDERDPETEARAEQEKAKLVAADEPETQEEAEAVPAGSEEGGSNLF